MKRWRLGMLGMALAGTLVALAARADRAQDIAALRSFTLTDGFLAKYQAVETDVAKDPCRLGALSLLHNENKSIDQMVAQYDAQPGVHAMLASHGLTARQLILGMITLLMAGTEELQKEHPGMVQTSGRMPPVSAANLAFYRAHKTELRQHMMQIGKEQLRLNHGKLPHCLASRD